MSNFLENKERITIGRKDRIDLPELLFENLLVKIDSGAYSCSIHCSSIELDLTDEPCINVIFLDPEHPKYNGVEHRFYNFKQKNVKSSTGEAQLRYFIQLKIKLFDNVFITDFSLTTRNNMRHPILLGRKILNRKFIIDTAKVNLSYNLKKARKK